MAQTYDVKLYKNTGFDAGNLPANPSVLNNFTADTAPAVYKFQSQGLAEIKLDKTIDEVADVDYVVIGDNYYIVTGIAMASSHTAIMSLTLDPINTAGGVANIQVVGGWVKRAHTRDDKLFANIIPEPWVPSRQLQMEREDSYNAITEHKYYHLIGVTVDLNWVTKTADVYEGISTTDATIDVAVPHMEPLRNTTQIIFDTDTESASYSLPNTKLYCVRDGDEIHTDVLQALVTLRSLGIDSAITCSYLIPHDYGAVILYDNYPESDLDRWSVVSISLRSTHDRCGMAYNYGQTPKNNKVLALYNTYKVVSNTTTASMEFTASEIASPGETGVPADGASDAPEFRLIRDASPNGCCYMGPRWYEGSKLRYLQQAVQGQQWLNEPIALYGSSGNLVADVAFARGQSKAAQMTANQATMIDYNNTQTHIRNKMAARHDVSNYITGGIGAITDPSVGSVSSAINTYLDMGPNASLRQLAEITGQLSRESLMDTYDWTLGDNLFSHITNTQVVAPDVICPQSPSFQGFFGNTFTLTHTHLAPADVTKFDQYLTMYGYADDRQLEHADLNSRQKFNYILTQNAQLKSLNAPLYIMQMAAQTMDNGVRLWHVAPNAAAYDDNPMR